MKAEEIGFREAKLTFSYDEVAQLAALAIKHSDNEELRTKLEVTYAVMGIVHDDIISNESSASATGGARVDDIIPQQRMDEIIESRQAAKTEARKNNTVSFRDIVGDKAADRVFSRDALPKLKAGNRAKNRKARRRPLFPYS